MMVRVNVTIPVELRERARRLMPWQMNVSEAARKGIEAEAERIEATIPAEILAMVEAILAMVDKRGSGK